MKNYLLDIVKAQDKGASKGVYSVCSSNKYVLVASMLQAKEDESFLLIEPTANQVNQFGGYTGMKPKDFVDFIQDLADQVQFPVDRIVLGGDHLGPNPWKNETAEEAMEKSRELVKVYVQAGFTKIHLDTSIPCADDDVLPGAPLNDYIVAERSASLCQVAEETYLKAKNEVAKPVYVIGTEVPIPGGAEGELEDIEVTSVSAAQKTLEVTKEVFYKRGLGDVWDRVIAQVVQPGVEFGNSDVVEYDPSKSADLSQFIKNYEGKVFEAHSTDYQPLDCLGNLVKDSFAILKVGPWLTFAFREAVFALSMIEEEMAANQKIQSPSNFREVLDQVMLDHPEAWEKHYHGEEPQLKFLRKYSYSDRSRYYWENPTVKEALETLFDNLSQAEIPLPLLSQYLTNQYRAVLNGQIKKDPKEIVLHKIREVTAWYSHATQATNNA
ncbi:D-tagatose-bisphosphate aldolase, class II, non-catalytic subunit [Gracilimonas mengyeensis]|uniref:Tagatose-bisphosphate aldolase noncatalytic subunit n=1 Tax=Gracilimonas mengyeensis TaxID=1302730 RepID=A0A521BSW8_9BACT|nr:D-tagatose-bisphosphate aldolase, class II, non-catalytic subunit [Gracilimonas mengyeensis]SMO50246.1 tagatose-bisphosphate aldolase noncatalytic subunit [Gracilimonas mengyeensis]